MRPTGLTIAKTVANNLFTDFVAVAGGRNVYVQCAGSGSPTIILESGDEIDHTQWGLVAPSLAERTRTCSYDRLWNWGE